MTGVYHAALVVLVALACSTPVSAKTYTVSPNGNWFATISGDHLKPGDEVVLTEGVYRDARRLQISHRGAARRPVVIRAEVGKQVVLHRPDAEQNSINVVGAQYLILRGLEITGGSTGIRLMKSDRYACKFVTLEELHIHHVGGAAVTANTPDNLYEGLVFRRNHIHHTSGHGEGFYLGANNKADSSTAACMFNSRVEQNYIHHLNGPKVLQGDGIEIKDGSYNNLVQDNVIHDTNYPGVLVYGTDGREPNIIQRNVIWNSANHGIQAAAEAIIQDNIVFNNAGDGIYSRAHQSAQVGYVKILHNTVATNKPGSTGIRFSMSDQPRLAGPVIVANNAVYVPADGFALRVPRRVGGQSPVVTLGNVGTGRTEGLPDNSPPAAWNASGQLARDLDENYYPKPGSLLIGSANPRFVTEQDFLETERQKARDVGAYALRPGKKTGWTIAPGFKASGKTGD